MYSVLVFWEIRRATGLNFNNLGPKVSSGTVLISATLLDTSPCLMQAKDTFKK